MLVIDRRRSVQRRRGDFSDDFRRFEAFSDRFQPNTKHISMASASSEQQLCYGPEDPSVLFHQNEHISASLLANGTTNVLRVRRTESKVWALPIHEDVMHWLDVWGFRGVIECGRPRRMDNDLITALIERWRPETHCFHLPVGEVTVTLQDVQNLWGLRAAGRVFTGCDYPIGYEDWPSKCRDVLGWIPDAETETKHGGLLMTSLINQATMPLGDGLHEYAYVQRARIHALILLGGLILPDTTGCKVPFMWINAFDDPEDDFEVGL
ncbi:protein MAIN-LIKE 1-like [Salvia splendens]|uniref:protein MAIN-LIKE 1-like n=1 Tax=Salvia splendens TaxID=180675 RepID=UPI001C258F94|nr:protein MAIN-LIKE 1-like [Salvia splendens]